jgi:arylsulfatase
MFDLRSDPFERADITSNTYYDWFLSNDGIMYGMLAGVGEFLQTFKEFPPSQRPQSFSIDQMVDKLHRTLEAGTQ